MRGDDLGGDATVEFLCEGVGEGACEADVTGRECTQVLVVGRGLLHLSVIHILTGDSPCAPVADAFDEGCAGGLGTLHVGHVVEVDGAVADAVDEGRVMEDHRRIVVGDGDVVATQGGDMGTDGQTEEVVGGLALLREDRGREKKTEEDKGQ